MFRFTIRELLLFTLVVGLAIGWWIDRSLLAATQQSIEEQRNRADWQFWVLAELIESRPGNKVTRYQGWTVKLYTTETGTASVNKGTFIDAVVTPPSKDELYGQR